MYTAKVAACCLCILNPAFRQLGIHMNPHGAQLIEHAEAICMKNIRSVPKIL
jgi:hypothetical protein